jgi:sn-glycerol 3-phosphate transport system substrate-binding protein
MSARRLAALLLVLALPAAACGGGEEGAGDDAEEPGTPTEEEVGADDDGAEPDVDDVEVAADDIAVPVWIAFTDDRLDWARERATEFNEAHEGITVTIQGYDDYETLFQSTQLAAEQGQPPAIVQYFEAATQEARDVVKPDGTPLFASVEERIAGRDEILGEPVVLGDIVDSVTSYYTLDGEFTSMPWNTSSAILFSNGTLLQEAGISEPPDTWQEVEEACEAIAALDDAPAACITWPNHGWFFEQSVGQQGGLLANNDNGRSGRATEVHLDSEEMRAYVEWWKEMEEAGHYVYTGTQRDWSGTYNAFIAQETALLVYSSSDTTLLTEDGAEAGFDVVASFMPHNDEVDYDGNLIGGATLWLVDGLEPDVEEAALAFLQFFNNPENAADWHRVTGYIPITNAAVDLLEEEGWFEENPNSRVASEQLDAASGSPASTGVILGAFVAIRDVVTEAMEEILVNDVEVGPRLEQADQEAQALLDDYNALFSDE